MDEAARLCQNEGEFAVIIGSLTAANQIEWRKYVEERRATQYSNMKMVAVRPCDDLKDKAQSEATTLLSTYPNLKLFLSTTSLGVPSAAEAVKQAGKVGRVKVVGLGLPSENRRYVKEGVTDSVILWKTEDLGYLAVQAAFAAASGALKPGDKTFKAGRLGEFQIQGDNILLGKPLISPYTRSKKRVFGAREHQLPYDIQIAVEGTRALPPCLNRSLPRSCSCQYLKSTGTMA
jgi:rhamnose transport system substrate-binding protein